MWQKLFKIFKSALNAVVIMIIVVLWAGISYYLVSFVLETSDVASNNSLDGSTPLLSNESGNCNVYGISLHGDVVTYNSNDAYSDQGELMYDQTSADEVTWEVDKAQYVDNVKAIVVEIDSTGGSGEAGEEMMLAFKQSKKPVVAFIRNAGLSAAYLAATGAQTIFASELSDVGSIGVTMSYLQTTGKDTKEGLEYIDLSSGKYKDLGSPSQPLSAEGKQILMRDVKISYEYFIKIVAQNRNLDIEEVRKIADGSSVMGEQALKYGLIDKIGLLPDVEKFLTEKIGAPAAICWQN